MFKCNFPSKTSSPSLTKIKVSNNLKFTLFFQLNIELSISISPSCIFKSNSIFQKFKLLSKFLAIILDLKSIFLLFNISVFKS